MADETHAEHVVRVVTQQPPTTQLTWHRGECTCGWSSQWRRMRTTAQRAALTHLQHEHERR